MNDIANLPLYDGEERCAVVRTDFLALLPRIFFIFVWVVMPFFFFFPILRMGFFGIIFLSAVEISAALYIFVLRRSWHGCAFVLTTLRCIDVTAHGFRRASSLAVPWKDVVEVGVQPQTFWQRLCGLGTVRVTLSAAHSYVFVLSGVKNPTRIQQLFHDVQCIRSYKKGV